MEAKKPLTKAEAIKQGKASVNLDHTSKAKQHVIDGEKDKSMLLTKVQLHNSVILSFHALSRTWAPRPIR